MAYPYTTPAEWFGFPDRPRCYLLEVDAFRVDVSGDPDGCYAGDSFGEEAFAGAAGPATNEGAVTLRYATHAHVTPSGDTPANTEYEARLEAVRVDARIQGEACTGWFDTFAEADLLNGDGGLDTWLSQYAVEGRSCVIRLGEPGWYLDTGSTPYFSVLYRGQVREAWMDASRVRLRIGHGYGAIDRPLAVPTYAGSGGNEGGDDLKGKHKPAVYGLVRNAPLVLVDTATLTYQVHYTLVGDLVGGSIISLFDRGIPLTKVWGAAPTTGQYSENTALGLVTLGGAPAGTVTADLYGHALSPTSSDNTWDALIEYLFNVQGLDYDALVDTTAMTAWNPNDVGSLAVGLDPVPARDLVAYLLEGAGLFGGFDRLGKFLVGRVNPSGTPAHAFDDGDIVALERERLPAALDPIVSKVQINYKRNWSPQPDLASGVTAAQRSFAAQEWRTITLHNTQLESAYPSAKTLVVNSPWDSSTDATDQAHATAALWGVRRNAYRVTTTLKGAYGDAATAAKLDLGTVVSLTHARFGLSAATATVVSWSLDSTRNAVELGVIV